MEESEEIKLGIKDAWDSGSYGSYALLVWYEKQYMAVQNSIAGKKIETSKQNVALDPAAYRLKWIDTMRLVSWCGTGTHALMFYGLLFAAYFLSYPQILGFWFVLNNGVLSAIWVICYARVKEMAEQEPAVCGYRLYVERENTNAQKTYTALGMAETEYKLFEELKPSLEYRS